MYISSLFSLSIISFGEKMQRRTKAAHNEHYIDTSCKRSVARRVRVLLTPETIDDACIYIKIIKDVKICRKIL